MSRRLAATALVAAGVLLASAAAAGVLYVRSEPAVTLTNADPHLYGSAAATARPSAPGKDLAGTLVQVSSYAANRQVETRPAQPHTGLWVQIPSLQISLPVREGDGGDRVPQWQAL